VTVAGLSASYSPLVTPDGLVALVSGHNDTVVFLDESFEVVHSLNVTAACGDGTPSSSSSPLPFVVAAPALDVDGTAPGDGPSILLPLGGSGGCCCVGAGAGNFGQVGWRSAAGGVVAASDPLVAGGAAWLVGSDGAAAKLSLLDGSLVASGAAELCSTFGDDAVRSAATQLDDSGALVVVSAGGCVTALGNDGTRLWSLPRAADPAKGDVLVAPAVDPDVGQVYWLHAGGALCCALATNGSACGRVGADPKTTWPSTCVDLVDDGVPAASVPSGLAISPAEFDFHGGDIYAIGADGTIFAVSARTGDVASASRAVPATTFAAPLVVPDAWGPDNNALVVVSSASLYNATPGDAPSSSAVAAYEVGNNGARADDDPADDDGRATTGFVWQLTLPHDAGSVVARGAAVLDDGSVVLVTGSGDVVIVGGAHAAVEIDSPWVESVVISGVVLGSLGILAAGFLVARRQRIATAMAAEMEGGEADSSKAFLGDEEEGEVMSA
jgi:hypothetical protein